MKLKKLSSVLLASAMVISLAACGSGDSGKEESGGNADEAAEAITSIEQLEGKTIGVQTDRKSVV